MSSTSATSMGRPEVHELGGINSGLCTPTSRAVAPTPFAAALAARSLHSCGTQWSAGKGYIYSRPEDNPTPPGSLLQALEDSL